MVFMSNLHELRKASSLNDVAKILNFRPKSLSYILYIKRKDSLYNSFDIPKRNGGTREISAPCKELKKLQTRLSELLLSCLAELHLAREEKAGKKIVSSISHAFSKNKSIITNAACHRNRRYVFNADLENFFGEINFPRIRGFLIKNRDFQLHPHAATVLAQIACWNDSLPQGAPCSPVISNLVAHILDIRLAKLAKEHGCSYTRYADDLTFSTNKKNFPDAIAFASGDNEIWAVGKEFSNIISHSGFRFNHSKTRMQLDRSRQEVTGLVVNKKVSCRVEYRRNVRAMVYELIKNGEYYRSIISKDGEGKITVSKEIGTMNQLNGMLNFVDMINVFNRAKDDVQSVSPDHLKKNPKAVVELNSNEKIYKRFIFYKRFFATNSPTILCEGKTDYIYLQCAIRGLVDRYPNLGVLNKKKAVDYKVNFFRFSSITSRFFGLSGGSGQLRNFLEEYEKNFDSFKVNRFTSPVIILIDSDSGAREIFGYLNKLKIVKDDKAPFYKIFKNLYIVATPLIVGLKNTMIENFLDKAVTDRVVNGKTFSWSNHYEKDKSYNKNFLAEFIVKKEKSSIKFDGFIPLLDRINAVIEDFEN